MNIDSNYECLLKLLIVGDMNVGKTNFILRFTSNDFKENYINTIGFDFKCATLKTTDQKSVRLQIWDTAGQERFMSLTKSLVVRVQGIILMYDVTNLNSFNNLQKWVTNIRDIANEKIPIIIVGNKIDLDYKRKISFEEGKKLAQEYGLHFMEASAKNNINVRETFIEISNQILKVFSKIKIEKTNSHNLRKENNTTNSNSNCC